MLESKNVNEYDVVLKYLNDEYGLLKVDYKLFYSNLLRHDKYIEHYQKIIVL